jgi:hypothetical protein
MSLNTAAGVFERGLAALRRGSPLQRLDSDLLTGPDTPSCLASLPRPEPAKLRPIPIAASLWQRPSPSEACVRSDAQGYNHIG